MKRSERTFVRHLFGAKLIKVSRKNEKNRQNLSAGNHSLRLPALRPCLLKHSKIIVLSTTLEMFCGAIFVNLLLPGANVSAASLTLSIPESISVSVNTQNNITYKESGKSNITIKTDAFAGYTLNIKSSDGTNVLRSSDGKTINSIESPLDNYQASGVTNSWAFLPGKLNSTENSTYQPGPKADLLLGKSSGSNSEPDAYPISIAAKIDGNQPTGTYKNSFTVSATANPVPYKITYNTNGGSDISPNPQTGTGSEGSTIKITETIPTKPDYEFLGWCTVNPGASETCSGTQYSAGQTYTLTNSGNELTLYARWRATKEELLTSLVTVDSGVTQITFKVGSGIEMIMVGDPTKDSVDYWRPSYGFSGADIVMPVTGGEKIVVSVTPKANYKLGSWTKTTGSSQTWTANGVSGTYQKMKDVTHATCVAAGEEGMNVTDERNGISYTIGNFAERCWMFSNLRLEPGTTLTPSTSDVSSNFTLPTQADSDGWTSASQNYFSKKNMKVCKGATSYTTSGVGGGKCADQTIGVTEYYYNWYTAIANDAIGSDPTSNTSATSALDSQSKGSICPKGWHLHSGSTNGAAIKDLTDAWKVDKASNLGRLVSSGSFYAGGQSNVGARGRWWSGTRASNNDGLQLRLNNGAPDSAYYTKSYACSVRCEL